MSNSYRLRLAGVDEFQRAIRSMRSRVPDALIAAFDEAADVIVQAARPQVPRRSGRAQASLEARSTTRGVAIAAGGSTAPYFPWLDYGGRVGRKKSTPRRFIRDGRYIWPTFADKREKTNAVLVAALRNLAESEGLRVR